MAVRANGGEGRVAIAASDKHSALWTPYVCPCSRRIQREMPAGKLDVRHSRVDFNMYLYFLTSTIGTSLRSAQFPLMKQQFHTRDDVTCGGSCTPTVEDQIMKDCKLQTGNAARVYYFSHLIDVIEHSGGWKPRIFNFRIGTIFLFS